MNFTHELNVCLPLLAEQYSAKHMNLMFVCHCLPSSILPKVHVLAQFLHMTSKIQWILDVHG